MVKFAGCTKSKQALTLISHSGDFRGYSLQGGSHNPLIKSFLKTQSDKRNTQYSFVTEFLDDIGEKRFLTAVRKFVAMSLKKWRDLMAWIKVSVDQEFPKKITLY